MRRSLSIWSLYNEEACLSSTLVPLFKTHSIKFLPTGTEYAIGTFVEVDTMLPYEPAPLLLKWLSAYPNILLLYYILFIIWILNFDFNFKLLLS